MAARFFKQLTVWKSIGIILLVSGAASTILRFSQGLGASTNLSDEFPWGIWIGFDVLCGVGLAAGGFTLAALVYVFNLKRFEPIVRPTILTAFLGYILVTVGLMFDLGRPWAIWHAIMMWNPHSVMFEVAWCVMLYSTVLGLEFAPVVLEKFQMHKTIRILHSISIPIIIIGVLLSTLHQSSLGTMYLIMPEKLYPLWYTPYLPVFFYVSAISVGCAMVIFESFLSSRAFKRGIEMPLLMDVARLCVLMLLVLGMMRTLDLVDRHAVSLLRDPENGNLYVLAGDRGGDAGAAYFAFDQKGAGQSDRAVFERRACDHRLCDEPDEYHHHRHGSLGRQILSALDPRVLGDALDRHRGLCGLLLYREIFSGLSF